MKGRRSPVLRSTVSDVGRNASTCPRRPSAMALPPFFCDKVTYKKARGRKLAISLTNSVHEFSSLRDAHWLQVVTERFRHTLRACACGVVCEEIKIHVTAGFTIVAWPAPVRS